MFSCKDVAFLLPELHHMEVWVRNVLKRQSRGTDIRHLQPGFGLRAQWEMISGKEKKN